MKKIYFLFILGVFVFAPSACNDDDHNIVDHTHDSNTFSYVQIFTAAETSGSDITHVWNFSDYNRSASITIDLPYITRTVLDYGAVFVHMNQKNPQNPEWAAIPFTQPQGVGQMLYDYSYELAKVHITVSSNIDLPPLNIIDFKVMIIEELAN